MERVLASCSSVLCTIRVYSCSIKLQWFPPTPGKPSLFGIIFIFSKQLLIPPCSTVPCLIHKHLVLFIAGHTLSQYYLVVVQNNFTFNLAIDKVPFFTKTKVYLNDSWPNNIFVLSHTHPPSTLPIPWNWLLKYLERCRSVFRDPKYFIYSFFHFNFFPLLYQARSTT